MNAPGATTTNSAANENQTPINATAIVATDLFSETVTAKINDTATTAVIDAAPTDTKNAGNNGGGKVTTAATTFAVLPFDDTEAFATSVFTENFTGSALNTTRWTIAGSTCANTLRTMGQLYANNSAPLSFSAEGVTVSVLNAPISLDICEQDYSLANVAKNYTSSRFLSSECYSHGIFEVIAKMPNGTYTWPAIWLECYNCTDANYFEIDIIETYGPKLGYSGEMSAFYNRNTTGDHSQNYIPETYDLINQFHNYTVVWVNGFIGFFFDGIEIGKFNYSAIPKASHLDEGCAILNINLALEGTARNGISPNYSELASDEPYWSPLSVRSINIFQGPNTSDTIYTSRCISYACTHIHISSSQALRNAEEIPVAIAISLFLIILLLVGFGKCSRLSIINVLRAFWTGVIILAILSPAIVGYFLHWEVFAKGVYALGTYGIFTMVHYSVQIYCVILHKIRLSKARKIKARNPDLTPPVTAISNAVYRETPALFEQCMRSILEMKRQNNKYIIVVADGQRLEEEYLVDIFLSVFPENSTVIRLDSLENRRVLRIPLNGFGKPYSAIFVTQPWGGKREAMYTAMALVINDPEVKAILTTDSDTVFDRNALNALSYELRNPLVGAVAGECRIINRWDSFISYVSDVRYNFAFNIERACQSLHYAVVCVSGPIGMYRTQGLEKIMDKWVDQRFMKTKCTYGDDRHLTNLFLNEGWKIVYTPDAFCYTESPSTILAFFKQQTRWCKSFYREFAWSMPSFHKQSLWFGYEMTFQLIYPFLLLYWQLIILFTGTYVDQLLTVTIIVAFAMLKATAAFAIGGCKNPKLFYYPFHFLFFITVLFPAKLMALVTLWDMSWGTRGMGVDWMNRLVLTLWNLMLLVGVALSVRNIVADGLVTVLIKSSVLPWEYVVGSMFVIALVMYLVYLVSRYNVLRAKNKNWEIEVKIDKNFPMREVKSIIPRQRVF
ncbi:Hyaluronan synthase 3 [Physocladia obscura]|uniref:Hyaluronan synthase 3 n=1 Tax=Physocladia obscura TaxID=109957 RepID=A0AAD5TBL1_9FUNG|nr:Hyaluronan synthase 3 [Physocladia obscura]